MIIKKTTTKPSITQPSVRLPVYAPPNLPIRYVRGFIFEPFENGLSINNLFEDVTVDYGTQLSFCTTRRLESIWYRIYGIGINGEILAVKQGLISDLDVLHVIHLDSVS